MSREYSREEILAMEPGIELDELVIRKLFKLNIVPEGTIYWSKAVAPFPYAQISGYDRWRGWHIWEDAQSEAWVSRTYNPSEDIEAAWELVEKFDEITIRRYETIGNESRYVCRIQVNHHTQVTESAPTAPEAICKAALLAVMG